MNIEKAASIAEYPEEFLIACGIYQLQPEELLQQFVNRFFYSGLLCGAADDTEDAVNEVIYDYLHKVSESGGSATAESTLHRKWLKKLNAIIDKGWKLPDQELKANMSATLLACRKEICKKTVQATEVFISGGHTIYLPGNFIVMCFMYGISAEGVLQHLIDNISLGKEAAINQYGVAVFNPFMVFFHSIAKQFLQDSRELHMAGFYQYDKELVALYEEMKGERDYDIRLSALTKHYKNWYEGIKHVAINSQSIA